MGFHGDFFHLQEQSSHFLMARPAYPEFTEFTRAYPDSGDALWIPWNSKMSSCQEHILSIYNIYIYVCIYFDLYKEVDKVIMEKYCLYIELSIYIYILYILLYTMIYTNMHKHSYKSNARFHRCGSIGVAE